MQVSEAMTNDVRIASPNQTIRDAARLMAQIDAGVLPVGENDKLVGMITDRDIALTEGAGSAGSALCGISEPGGEHSQSMDGARGMRGT